MSESIYFQIGIEDPISSEYSYSIVIPALCMGGYEAYSAADSEDEIPDKVLECAETIVHDMQEKGMFHLGDIKARCALDYSTDYEFSFADRWETVQIPVSFLI